ncbi:MAG: insulinase family protein [Rhizobiaceae bacterium]|jgi:predicted Zn-dependent peptidase|nr:insulinase family protein [Rhizobiaceae bacterium]
MTIEISKLANGMTVVTDHMPHLESAALGVWVKAGSRNENRDQHGIAHLLEHMAFKGTKNRSALGIAEEIESVGGELNAATSVETTAYYARVLSSEVNHAADILHDILANSVFDEQELQREKHVILQEIGAALDAPDDLVFDHFQSTAFGNNQPIGRPILGTPETVSDFTTSQIRDYLSDHYHGPNMVLSAAGSVDHASLLKQAENTFAHFPDSPVEEASEASYVGGEVRLEDDFQEAQIILGFEGRAYHVKDFYASQLLATILGGGMSSRLFQEIRERHGLCYSISAFHWGFSDTGVFGIHAATGQEDLQELVTLTLTELQRASETIKQSELDRARAQIRAGLLMAMESPAARAGQIARQILLFGRQIPNEELMERLDALSVERVRDLAGRIFQESVPTLAAVGPIANAPRLEDIRERLGTKRQEAAE